MRQRELDAALFLVSFSLTVIIIVGWWLKR